MFEALFQTFDDPASAAASSRGRIEALRAELKRRGLDGFVVPRADRHQGEYVPPADERLAWLTGFTGSAGSAVVLTESAALFVDGRYTLQAREQADLALFTIEPLAEVSPEAWIERQLPAGARLGYDPWLHTVDGTERLAKACAAAYATLVPVAGNPLDAVWTDRPAPPLGHVVLHDIRFAGESAAAKLARIREQLAALKADALIVSDPAALAWTFNIRGNDVAHTPVPLGFAILPLSGQPALYLDPRKLDDTVRGALAGIAALRDPSRFEDDVVALGAAGRNVRLDQSTGADALARLVAQGGGKATAVADPVAQLKAVKNAAEIAGTRAAHRRDGAALTRFLAWFDTEAPRGVVSEIDAVEALESFRRDTGALKDVSFPTIAGAGPNGAIVHYRVTRGSNRRIAPGDLFLIDSGAQYEDGTTDVTRTIAVGTTTPEMRTRFTHVLRGHIAIACAVFPDGSSGAQLDSFARQYLWAAGLDFDHGTGHGVGSYLSVHEGPARISKLGTAPLKRGMILSNEPGYYKTGAYGIRIENLELVVEAPPVEGAERPLDCFETLTLVPIDRRLIDPALMTADEIAWLDGYHARVNAELGGLLDAPAASWLAAATKPLG